MLNDPTRSVSGVHAGLYFDPKTLNFHIRNLTRDRLPPKQPNPVWVNGRKMIQEEPALEANSQIQLGHIVLRVKSIEVARKDQGVSSAAALWTPSRLSAAAWKTLTTCPQNIRVRIVPTVDIWS